MPRFRPYLAALLLLPLLVGHGLAEEAPAAIRTYADSQLMSFGQDPVIVAAVRSANAEGRTLEQIQARDEVWRNTPGFDAGMQAMLESPCGRHLADLMDQNSFFAEIFVMDALGANVAMSAKTSDYWQGDEAKFQESFAGGKGAVHIGEVEFDDSSQSYLVQVSVPVVDGTEVIGAITFGIDVDAFEQSGV